MSSLDATTPAANSKRRDGDDYIRAALAGIADILGLDHQMASNPYSSTNLDGQHKKVTFFTPLAADPAAVANKGVLYTKDVSSVIELFWEDESGNVIQLTSGGKLNGAILKDDTVDDNAILLDHDGWLTGAGHTSGSVNLIRATGAAGSEYAEIPDGARTATDAAPAVDAGVANKKYVDDAIPAAFTPDSVSSGGLEGDLSTSIASFSTTITYPNGLKKLVGYKKTDGLYTIDISGASFTGILGVNLTLWTNDSQTGDRGVFIYALTLAQLTYGISNGVTSYCDGVFYEIIGY